MPAERLGHLPAPGLKAHQQRAVRLQEEITQRKPVAVAEGILKRERGLSEADGCNLIQKRSRDENMKTGEAAKLVIELHGTPEERKKFA